MWLILIDIDGVIAPLALDKTVSEDIRVFHEYGDWIIPHFIANWLKRIDNVAELMWSSSWEEESNDISKVILGKDLPYIDFSMIDSSSEWLKVTAILTFIRLNLGRRILVIDDEMTVDARARLEKLGALCYIPNGKTGLTHDDLARLNKLIGTQVEQ